MHYQLLGPMTVIHDDTEVTLGGLRQRGVLAALLLAAGRTVATDTLVEMVWADAPPAKPIASLRAYIANLRRLLGGQRVVTDRSGYRLNLGTDRLDIREFETLVADSRRLLDAGDHVAAARTVERSLRLWRGVPLADFRDQPFVHYEMHRLEALRADALETRFEAQLGMGRSWELIAALETEVTAHPLREKLWAQMMLAMYRSGRRADALHAYGRVRTLLERELGVRPVSSWSGWRTRSAVSRPSCGGTVRWTPCPGPVACWADPANCWSGTVRCGWRVKGAAGLSS